jgi:short-subunit dehydrogenase
MSRRILITGASGGLGRALALALARADTELILTGRRADALNVVAEIAKSKGEGVETHILELASPDAVSAFGQEIASQPAGLDVLVHNAAVIRLGTVAESNVADLDWHYGPNVRSPVLLTQHLLGRLRQARGQIVFINSAAGLVARKGAAFYAATKHALKAVADSLREELASSGVTVLSVFPSRMNTPMQERVLAMEGSTANLNSFHQPDDLARVIVEAMERCRRGEINNVTFGLREEPRFW